MSAKKREGKKRKSPCTPLREKGKAKEKTKTGIHEYTPSTRGRARATGWKASEAEAREAVNAILEEFGTEKDRNIWQWYVRKLGLNKSLDLFDQTVSEAKQGEVDNPPALFHRRLQEAYRALEKACLGRSAE